MRNKSSDQDPPEWARSLSTAVNRVRSQPAKQSAPRREAAVLVLLTDGPDGVQVLLTERASGLRSYPGRVSFPGGKKDPTDADPPATALREANEEIGLNPASVHILGSLPTVVDPQGKYIVTPVLAWSARPDFTGLVSSAEVAKVHQVAIRDLSAAHGSGKSSEGSAALASQLGEMTAAIVETVVSLLDAPTAKNPNDIHPDPPHDRQPEGTK